MRMVIWGIVLVVVAGMAWIRLAPSDVARWHRSAASDLPGDYPSAGGFVAVRDTACEAASVFAELDDVIRATPRTQVLTGSLETGMITYITRSRVIGFPDYTTVSLVGDRIQINGRLRFGQSDLGVNRARIGGWIAQVSGFSGP